RRLVFEFGNDALGNLRSDAGRTRHHGFVAHGDGGGELARLERAEHGERDLGADALDGLQEPKPFALDLADKSKQTELILADMRLDRQRGGLTDARQFLKRARRAMNLITDAIDVDDDGILTIGLDQAFELADHDANTFSTALCRWCACVTATASASAASSEAGSALGNKTPIIIRTCALSPWPAPTMLFFTRFGAYSATGTPALAGTTMAIPRAWPSFNVAAASLLTN